MTDSTPSPLPTTIVDDSPAPALWIERVAPRRYVGYSERGGVVQIGGVDDDDTFTPGELLKIAVAGCTGLSSDAVLTRSLGDNYNARIHVSGIKNAEEDRYPGLIERLEVDLSGLDPMARERLLIAVNRAIDQTCTVQRTLTVGATVELNIESISHETT